MSRSVGIVVPAYRPDPDRLTGYLRALLETVEPDALVVELDTPTQSTVTALSALPPAVEVSTSPYRRGKGAAITAGFEHLDTDVLAFADADGSTPATDLQTVIDRVATDAADLAVGSRRHPDSTVHSHQTLARRYLGDGFALAGRLLLDAKLYDFQCGAKAIEAEAWDQVREHIYEPGFAWDIELVAMAAALDLRIEEVPIEWEDRPGSTVSPVRTTLSMGKALLVARHRAKQLRNDPIHRAIAAGRTEPTALVDREEPPDE
jgi:glycosyltransferase involved in cell wall biosynthesis